MATPKRSFPAGTFYHVYNRGNHKQEIFLEDRDYRRFTERLSEYRQQNAITLIAYCLMPNHFHLLLKQNREQILPKFMLELCTSYSKYFNIKYGQVGRLFQDRFKAKPIEDERYLLGLSKYIHLNPQKLLAKGEKLQDYRWSSYPEYVSGNFQLTDQTMVLNYFSKDGESPLSYQAFVESGLTEKETSPIRDLLIDL